MIVVGRHHSFVVVIRDYYYVIILVYTFPDIVQVNSAVCLSVSCSEPTHPSLSAQKFQHDEMMKLHVLSPGKHQLCNYATTIERKLSSGGDLS